MHGTQVLLDKHLCHPAGWAGPTPTPQSCHGAETPLPLPAAFHQMNAFSGSSTHQGMSALLPPPR